MARPRREEFDSAGPKAPEFKSTTERDEYVETRYRHDYSRTPQGTALVWIAEHLDELATEFIAAKQSGEFVSNLREAYESWHLRKFGILERAAVGMVLRRVMEVTVNEQGFPMRRSYKRRGASMLLLETAVRELGLPSKGEGSESYLGRVCAQAGVKLGPGPKSMPDVPWYAKDANTGEAV